MKSFFTVLPDPCHVGFQEHVKINVLKPIEPQLHRRAISYKSNLNQESINDLKEIINWNSSLRIGFNWEFESIPEITEIMKECEENIKSPFSFSRHLVNIITDFRADWIGFEPFNVFDREFYEDFCAEDLVYFNNKLIEYQTNIVKFITQHKIFQSYSIVKDNNYRFKYFKSRRKDPIALSESFQYYIDSITERVFHRGTLIVGGIMGIQRDIVEEDVGCHFLYQPDLFFELIEFYKLKGKINE